MKRVFATLFRSAIVGLGAVAFLAASYTTARADEVTITGFSTGTHNVPFLHFVGNPSFRGTTALGIGALSDANRLGEFQLGPGRPEALVSGEFRLDITFTSPSGIAGGQDAAFTATIFGSVHPALNQEGGVNVHFHNPTQTFTFNDGLNSGSFSLTLADVYVQSRWEAKLTAGITGQQEPVIPEPTTLLLLGTGITGVAVKLRSRRKAKRAARTTEV